MRNIQEPVETQGDGIHDDGWKIEHPAFAVISAGRVSGSTTLFQSDFVHHHYITIRIAKATKYRSLSRDWVHAGREYIEVKLSEAQWATFVSSLNCGSGTPCTVEHINHQTVPGLPSPQPATNQFEREASEATEEAIQELSKLAADIEAAGLSKKKATELLNRVRSAHMALTSSLPFIADQFSRHMETTVEKAKVEIHAHAANMLMRMGLDAASKSLPIETPKAIEVSEASGAVEQRKER